MNSIDYKSLCLEAEEMLPELIRTRRDLHKYAESGWEEIRTASIAADRLEKLGYEVLLGREVCREEARMGVPDKSILDAAYERAVSQGAVMPYAKRLKDGFTGVVGILKAGEGPVIGIRCDLDALGVFEEKEGFHRPARDGFASVNEGKMHACGHDGHVAIGLGAAELLMKHRDLLHGTVKFIFQPAEEGVRGAASIAASGILEDVDVLLANHMGNKTDEGLIGLSTGKTLATTKLDAAFTGKAAHAGSHPDQGNNAMLSACTAVLNLHAIPRCGEAETRVNVGRMLAGSGRNVVCDTAKLELEVRGSDTETNAWMEGYARRVLLAAAEMHGCEVEISTVGAAPSVWSDPELLEFCRKTCSEKLGLTVLPPSERADASEDCSYLLDKVRAHGGKGLYFKTLAPCAGVFHGRTFDFQEEYLPNGVKALVGMTISLMESSM